MRVLAGLVLVVALGAAPSQGRDAPLRPVVAELFTSEGCSSCPPAEALLAELARRRPDVLALAFHVTYWDDLGWPDRFALPAATARQRAYAARLHLESVYTPQLVVDGVRDVVGSDSDAVQAALASAARHIPPRVPLAVTRVGGGVRVTVGRGQGNATLFLLGYDSRHSTAVLHGENAGRVLFEANVVRAIRSLGEWRGSAVLVDATPPPGEHLAVLLQAADGRILDAATTP